MGIMDPPFNYWIEDVPGKAFCPLRDRFDEEKIDKCEEDENKNCTKFGVSDYFDQQRNNFQKDVMDFMKRVPELGQDATIEDFWKRLWDSDMNSLCLVARTTYEKYNQEKDTYKTAHIVGLLAAYNKQPTSHNSNLHLWLGGTDTDHRGRGLMGALFASVEWWAKEVDYETLSAKTFPKFKNMIYLLEKNNFKKTSESDNGIYYRKTLDTEPHQSFRSSDFYKKYSFTRNGRFHFNVGWNAIARDRMRHDVCMLY